MANLTKLVGIEMWWRILCQLNTWERCFVSQWHRWLASQWEPPLWSSGYQSRCTTTKLQTFQHLTMSKCPKEMRKIYVASWILFTLKAEADRVLCQLVMSLTVFFHWMYKMKCSCYQESSVIQGWFVYWVFGWEIRYLSKSEIRFRMALFSFFTFVNA